MERYFRPYSRVILNKGAKSYFFSFPTFLITPQYHIYTRNVVLTSAVTRNSFQIKGWDIKVRTLFDTLRHTSTLREVCGTPIILSYELIHSVVVVNGICRTSAITIKKTSQNSRHQNHCKPGIWLKIIFSGLSNHGHYDFGRWTQNSMTECSDCI